MTSNTMLQLAAIDRHAKRYSAARARLSSRYISLQRAIRILQEKHVPRIKEALDFAATIKSGLEKSIGDAPALFVKPRTLTLHGVRVGMMEGKPTVTLPRSQADKAAVVAAIKERFTAEEIKAKGLIVVVETVSADALLELYKADAGFTIAGVEYLAGGDRVFIKPADHALDKVITKLLEEGMQTGTATVPEVEQEAA